MSLFDYETARTLKNMDTPFYALIMAAMMRTDSTNEVILRAAWPDLWKEVKARWNAPGALLAGEADGHYERAGFRGVAPINPSVVPARGNSPSATVWPDRKLFLVGGGALVCDHPIEGITQDQNEEKYYEGHRYFVAESMSRKAAEKFAQALGGFLDPA